MSAHPYDPAQLPTAVRTYLAAHPARDFEAMSSVLTDRTVIVDEDQEHVGREAIRAWLGRAANQYEVTEEYRSQTQVSASEWVVVNHLEGSFPGGVVDLRFRFTVDGGTLTRLVIAP